ncbi:MAG: AMP-binding protein [Alphaproteobacteria bacterium]|nr:AMP-binding protein [Alphaproteobacteria bacterium]
MTQAGGGDPLIMANMIRAKAQTLPDLDVLTFVEVKPDGSLADETRTYRQLWDRGRQLAKALEARGLKKGEHFALLMQNHPEFVEAMIAASILGAVFVPIDPRTKGEKLVYMLKFAECRGAVAADYALANLLEVLPGLPAMGFIAVMGGMKDVPARDDRFFPLADAFAGPVPEMEVRSADPAAPMQLLFTSGTTGDPKAIVAAHRRFVESGALARIVGLKDDDRPYTGLSLTHANAQLISLGMILNNGLRGVVSRKFTKTRLWDITRAYGCTTFNLLGGMTVEIYSMPEKPNDADNPVRMVLSAGMPAAIWEKFAKRFDVQIQELYGAAEGGFTINPPGVGPIGSVGKPLPGSELAILDDEGNRVPAGTPGEICFRPVGGAAQVRYLKNEGASGKKTEGGWLHTGDIGHVDENGWLFFHHRKGGEIRRNGDFINPAFVEKAVAEHPHVADVFVYGVPAKSGAPGEKDVVAAVVPEDMKAFDAASVFAHCRRALEANMVPSYLQVVAEIPKTASEKPQERFLRETLKEGAPNVFTP